MKRILTSDGRLIRIAKSAMLLALVVMAGCSTLQKTTDMIKANQQGVEASTASIRLNQEAVADSTDAIEHNQKAILASTAAIVDNGRAVQQSTETIVRNEKVLSDVTGTMEKLSPGKPQFMWAVGVVIVGLVTLYAVVVALLISSLRTGRAMRTIEAALHEGERHHDASAPRLRRG